MLFDEGVFSLPLQQFMVPVLWFSLARVLFGVVLYRVRVPAGWRDTSLPYLCAAATAAIAVGSGERLSHAA